MGDPRGESKELARRLSVHGWCLIDDVIPDPEIEPIRDALVEQVRCQRREHERHLAAARAAGHVVGSTGVEVCQDVISSVPRVAPYLADPRILGAVRAVFGPWVRITSTSGIVTRPGNSRGRWHADWPYNQKIGSHLPAPYPDAVLHLSSIFMLSEFSSRTGATHIVPGSHRRPNNPSSDDADHPAQARHPEEIPVHGPAGSVLLYDSRLWHRGGENASSRPRVAITCRFSPWWLNLEVRRTGSPEHTAMVVEGGGRDNSVPLVSRDVFEALPDRVKPLIRHWVAP